MQSISLTDLFSFFTNSVFSSFGTSHFSFHLGYSKGISESNERVVSSLEHITSASARAGVCFEVKNNAERVDA